MKEQLKKRLNVPENWDKFDYEIQRYSFNDILAIVEEMKDINFNVCELKVTIEDKEWEKIESENKEMLMKAKNNNNLDGKKFDI